MQIETNRALKTDLLRKDDELNRREREYLLLFEAKAETLSGNPLFKQTKSNTLLVCRLQSKVSFLLSHTTFNL